jgi:hypothetical protein
MKDLVELKVLPPYFDAIADGSKTFELRRNDRAYQRGDRLRLREFHDVRTPITIPCSYAGCTYHFRAEAHFAARGHVDVRITFVYAGDPRFTGLEPGHVVVGFKRIRSR